MFCSFFCVGIVLSSSYQICTKCGTNTFFKYISCFHTRLQWITVGCFMSKIVALMTNTILLMHSDCTMYIRCKARVTESIWQEPGDRCSFEENTINRNALCAIVQKRIYRVYGLLADAIIFKFAMQAFDHARHDQMLPSNRAEWSNIPPIINRFAPILNRF